MALITEIAPVVGVGRACDALGLAPASYYRFGKPKKAGPRKPRPTPARTLKPAERERMIEVLHSERFVDTAPAEIYATLL